MSVWRAFTSGDCHVTRQAKEKFSYETCCWKPFYFFTTFFSYIFKLEKKSRLVTRALSTKYCTRDTDSLHSCTWLRLVQEMACLYQVHSCKIWPRKHSYPNLIPIVMVRFNYSIDNIHVPSISSLALCCLWTTDVLHYDKITKRHIWKQ